MKWKQYWLPLAAVVIIVGIVLCWPKKQVETQTSPLPQEIIFSLPAGSGVSGSISAQEIETRLNLTVGTLEGLTITKLPDEKAALLRVDGETVKAYDYLSRDQLDRLTIERTGEGESISFSFLPQGVPAAQTTLSVIPAEGGNSAPSLETAHFETLSGIPFGGLLSAWDPDGDELRVNIVSAPQKGTLETDGLSFVYQPFPGESGTDRFTLTVSDNKGGYSAQTELSVAIEKMTDDTPRFTDLAGNPSHYAAIKLSEAGVMSGEQIGSSYLFYPEKEVTAGDYILMLLSAIDAPQPGPCVNTGLSNDADIPLWRKPYVKQALDYGILQGETFQWDMVIDRSMAVVYTDRAAQLTDERVQSLSVTDFGEIPQGALQAYMNLSANQMLGLYESSAKPAEPLDRAYAADLLWQLCNYQKTIDERG